MARSAEVVRQWEILRSIDGARHGVPVARLAAELRVHARTIRRDLDALCRAGFPLYDQKVNGTSMWKLRERPFRRLEAAGLSVTEACALHFGRSLLNALAGTPLLDCAERAFLKIDAALPAGCRTFLDQLPRVLQAKGRGRKLHDARRVRDLLSRVLDASLLHRAAAMTYASRSSQRTKRYVVEAQRIAYADGGLYLVAWVPEYGQMRTFAVERIQTFALLDERFEPRALPVEPFPSSLGVHTGDPVKVVVEFEGDAATYVREREWHRTQQLSERAGGGLVLTMEVCNDRALRAWVLGFGASAQVIEPISLAKDLFDEATGIRARYQRTLAKGRIEMVSMRAS